MRPTPFDPRLDLTPGITLLEASAGTGKTHSITSLFLRFVAEKGLAVDEILVVTFTVAATAELKDRIRERLHEAVAVLRRVRGDPARLGDIEDPVLWHLADASESERDVRLAHVESALSRMDDASISTIHGFCQKMLQRHPVESRVDLDAEVVEEDRGLLEEVADDLYVSTLNALDPDVARALRGTNFRSVLRALLHEIRNHPDATPVPAAEVPAPDPASWRTALERLREEWARCGAEATTLIVEAMEQGRLNRVSFKPHLIATAVSVLDEWKEAASIPFLEISDRIKYFASSYLRQMTKKGKSPPEHPFFDLVTKFRACTNQLNEDFAAFQRGLAARMIREVRARFAARKRDKRMWSFQDLLVFLRDALRDPVHGDALASAIRTQYRAALIDEFQDTDGVQWEIFRTVFDAPERFLFLIGDPKQAIYSFRGADIQAYLAAREHATRQYTLSVNWRSDGRWVRGLNTLYGRANRPFHDAGIGYVAVEVPGEHEEDRLRYPGKTHAPIVLRFVSRSTYGVSGTDPVTKGDLWRDLPAVVARDVANLLSSGAEIRTREGGRPIGPRDIAVLVRKHEQAWDVQKALKRQGIPSVLHSEASVFQSDAATDLALWLAAIVDPDDPEAVRTAATTSLLGLKVPGVVEMEAREGEWSSLIGDFRRWGEVWREQGFSRMFRAALHERSVLASLLAREGGERLATDLLHVAEILQVVATDSGAGPEALLAWLLRERTNPTVSSEARQLRLESDEDAVEVVTMHRAKGLQYPIVFCPYLWDGYFQETRASVLRFHEGQQIWVAARGLVSDADWETYRDAGTRETFAENLRLAYVALTRARHQCFVYWAPGTGHENSALAWLLFPPAESAPPEDIRSRSSDLDDAAMLQALAALAEASHGSLAIEPVERSPETLAVWTGQAESPQSLQVARWTRPDFDRSWQWTSFTRMVATRGGEEPGDDEAWQPARADGGEGDALLQGFPRGRIPGRCLHRVFERLDFACEDPEPVVREGLAEYGLDVEGLARPVTEAVRVTLDTPLPGPDGPVRLRDVGASDRLNEVPFLVPVAGGLLASGDAVSMEDLARAFEEHGGRLGPRYAAALRDLPIASLRGFLSGQMDLVFRVGSRWYLADYKSNDLGPRRAEYAPDCLEREMISSYYFLQYHIYAVALYRYGVARVPGFDWDRDFGGVFYLFVRGLDPSGRTGVFWDRPGRALLGALSDAFGRAS